jgi:nitrate reductase NapE component
MNAIKLAAIALIVVGGPGFGVWRFQLHERNA